MVSMHAGADGDGDHEDGRARQAKRLVLLMLLVPLGSSVLVCAFVLMCCAAVACLALLRARYSNILYHFTMSKANASATTLPAQTQARHPLPHHPRHHQPTA